MDTTVQFGKHGLCVVDPQTNLGIKEFGLRLTVEGTVVDACYQAAVETEATLMADATTSGALRVRSSAARVPALDAESLTKRLEGRSALLFDISGDR